MAIKIGSYNFDGPHTSTSALRKQSGVYAILGNSGNGNSWAVVDIGESEDVQERVENHDRAPCWKGQKHSVLAAAAYYAAERQRMQIEQELRATLNPPCGDR